MVIMNKQSHLKCAADVTNPRFRVLLFLPPLWSELHEIVKLHSLLSMLLHKTAPVTYVEVSKTYIFVIVRKNAPLSVIFLKYLFIRRHKLTGGIIVSTWPVK